MFFDVAMFPLAIVGTFFLVFFAVSFIAQPRIILSTLTIVAYMDDNGNGRFDHGDSVMANTSFNLRGPNFLNMNVTTDDAGFAIINGVGRGLYRITFDNGVVREHRVTSHSSLWEAEFGSFVWSLDELMAVAVT